MSQPDFMRQALPFVDAVAASVAFVEKSEDGLYLVTVCNKFFNEMFGGNSQLTQAFPFLLRDLIPRYNRIEFLSQVDQCFVERSPKEFEQAIDNKGATCWWRFSLKPMLDGDKVQRLLVTGHDITPKIELEHQLKIASSRFESVVEAAYDGIVTINQRDQIVLFNKAAEDLFGYDSEEVIGKSIETLIPKEARTNHSQYVDQFSRSPITSRQMDERGRVEGLHQDGTVFPIEIAISKINVGGMIEFTAIIRDMSEKYRLLDLLNQQASTDHLTGLLNRREFEFIGNVAFQRSKKTNDDLSVLMLDIDKFKNINDTYGHDIGDEVLQVLSKVGVETIRHLDKFARLGGEEFAVLLPETSKEQAMQMAERLRMIFDKQSFHHDWSGPQVAFKTSIGVAVRRPTDQGLQEIVKRADMALYAAKRNGRNRVEFGDASPEELEAAS